MDIRYKQIENTLLLVENAILNIPQEVIPKYSESGFRAGIYCAISVITSAIWDLQEKEGMDMEDRLKMVESFGKELRKLIKTYTNIDAHELYKPNRK